MEYLFVQIWFTYSPNICSVCSTPCPVQGCRQKQHNMETRRWKILSQGVFVVIQKVNEANRNGEVRDERKKTHTQKKREVKVSPFTYWKYFHTHARLLRNKSHVISRCSWAHRQHFSFVGSNFVLTLDFPRLQISSMACFKTLFFIYFLTVIWQKIMQHLIFLFLFRRPKFHPPWSPLKVTLPFVHICFKTFILP